jgi:N-acyl-D-aspartate/D-glutamate deacylase
LLTNNEAKAFLTDKLQELIKNQLQTRTKVLISDAQRTLSNRGLNLFLQAPDFYHAAAVLVQSKLTFANRNQLFEEVIEKGETCVAFKDKLRLLNMDFYLEHRLYKDGYIKGHEEERAEATRKIHYKVWLELVRRRRQLTANEFKQIFPEAGYKLDLWNETLDQNGQPRLNPKKFWTYVNEWKAKKREKKLKNKAEEAAKKKF